ncbi:MAG: hypothetical protein NT082_05795 [Chloroflexi bacterium]|nr:hypothetical protein [Chloroflexota bacterium]
MADISESGEKAAALAGDAHAIQYLKDAIRNGHHWYLALLGAIRLWKSPEETYNGELYRYLIGGQAFDWLRLAERLCEEIKEHVSENEIVALLFFDRPPVKLTEAEFKEILGPSKYRAYLNYLYGVLIEQALILANIYEVRKKSLVPLKPDDEMERAYCRIYRSGQEELLETFRKEMKYPRLKSITFSEMKEFTYWLFKYRVRKSEKPKIASDTKKALTLMYRKMSNRAV